MKRFTLILAALAALAAGAQNNGMWKAHPKYLGTEATCLVDARDKAFFIASNQLYAFDKTTLEVQALNKETGLNDINTTGLFRNAREHYTVVTYKNSNIDVVRDDGTVVNIPDLKDAIFNCAKGINDVTFSQGKMLVATQFGLVIIDGGTMQVKDTYYYNRNLTSAIQCGQALIVSTEDGIFYDQRSNHDNFDAFTATGMNYTNAHFFPINNNKFFLRSDEELDVVSLEVTDGINYEVTLVTGGAANYIQEMPGGFLANFYGSKSYYTFNEEGENATRVSATAEYFSCDPAGDGTVWAMGANGVHKKGVSKYYAPNGWGITVNAFYGAYNPGNGCYYVCRTTDNAILGSANSKPTAAKTEIWRYDGSKWKNVTPVGAPTDCGAGNYWLAFEPGQECSYFYSTRGASYVNPVTGTSSTRFGAIVHVVNDTVKTVYDGRNKSATVLANAPLVFMNALALDNDGNLWGVQPFPSRTVDSSGPYAVVLPKDKLHDPNVTLSDWILPNVTGLTGDNKRSTMAVSRGTNIKVFSIGGYEKPVYIWDDGGDPSNPNIRAASYTSIPDTDGTMTEWTWMRCVVPDTLGNIWVGFSDGFFYFNPTEAFNADFKVHHPKLKGETGYFLDGEDVICIAVDGQNRKWLGTANQGVVLVSEDGTELLAQFDATNSLLPSSYIYSITYLPNSNSIMVVTDQGIAQYYYEAPSGVETYDNVLAYPNPVTPDFTGYVTISGLVKDSYVTITDRKGNTVAQLQASGTTVHWDACDADGSRLETGVYNVFAGPSETEMSAHPVTQIRVIK